MIKRHIARLNGWRLPSLMIYALFCASLMLVFAPANAQSDAETSAPLTVSPAVGDLYINEILFNPSSTDAPNEYVELRGVPGATIASDTYLVAVEGDSNSPGDVQNIFNLSGLTLGSNGYLVILQNGNNYVVDGNATAIVGTGTGFDGAAGFQADSGTDIENTSMTFLLFETTSPHIPSLITDIDSDDDGTPDGDYANWTILDAIAVTDDDDTTEYVYADLAFAENASTQTIVGPAGFITVETTAASNYVGRQQTSTGSTASDWVAGGLEGTPPDWTLALADTYPASYEGRALDHIGSLNFPALTDVDLELVLVAPSSVQSSSLAVFEFEIYNNGITATDVVLSIDLGNEFTYVNGVPVAATNVSGNIWQFSLNDIDNTVGDPVLKYGINATASANVGNAGIVRAELAYDDTDSDSTGADPNNPFASFSGAEDDEALATVNITSGSIDLIITEIMYNAAGDEPNWEWVEVYNAGGATVDFSSTPYVIDDINSTAHTAANITSGSIAPATSGILYNADLLTMADFAANWGAGINLIPVTNWTAMSLNNSGDTVSLWDSFANYNGDHATHTNAVETVAYDDDGTVWPGDDGAASIFLTNTALDNNIGGNWTLSTDGANTPVGGAAYVAVNGDIGSPGGTFAPMLMITEIMYNPASAEDDWEWVEVYNAGSSTVDFFSTPYVIDDNNSTAHTAANITSGSIAPGDSGILYNSDDLGAANFEAAWGTGVNLIPVANWGAMGLGNGGDQVSLWDSFANYDGDHETQANAVETVAYDDDGTVWPADDGASSIYLTDTSLDNNVGTNWALSVAGTNTPVGGEAYTSGGGDVGSPGGLLNPSFVLIHEIQGAPNEWLPGGAHDDVSPRDGDTVTIEAIVVGDYQGDDELDGFFVQEEDSDADGDPTTSEGLFVYCGNACAANPVMLGERVQVTGSISEFFGMTQLTSSAITVIDGGNSVSPATIDLPIAGDVDDTYEQVEGMLVSFNDTLTVTEYFQLNRFGQIVLSEGGKLRQFTQDNMPNMVGYQNHQDDVARRRIILDDLNNINNWPLGGNNGDTPALDNAVYHPQPNGFSVTDYIRGGDTIDNLTGVLHWSWAGSGGTDAWRIRPVDTYPITFTHSNPRPTSAPEVGGNIQVASFNVLNYFEGPFPTSRGADSPVELLRQTDKIVDAMQAIDADVYGLMEIKNDGGPSLGTLTAALNSAYGTPGLYTYVNTGVIGTDDIAVAIIYRTSVVQPVGNVAVLDDPSFVDPNNTGQGKNRPAVAQSFEVTQGADAGSVFTVVVNHLKSKSDSGCAGLDCPQADGQGAWNDTRTKAAQELANWLTTDPTGVNDDDILIIGDLNAYRMEDPLTALQNANYTILTEATDYSYVFDGQWGELDHALASANMLTQVTGTAPFHINADENSLLDYNDTFPDNGESWFERKTTVNDLYDPDMWRSSDHDPVVIGLDLIPEDINCDAFTSPYSVEPNVADLIWAITCSQQSPGLDTLLLSPGALYNVTTFNSGTDTALPLINDALLIEGQNAAFGVANTSATVRVFNIGINGEVLLRDVTIIGGNPASGDGGSINNQGILSIDRVSIFGANSEEGGGGLNNDGFLQVYNSLLVGNSAAQGGGAIRNGGTLLVRNSTIVDNVALRGGGIASSNGSFIEVHNSIVWDNDSTADDGEQMKFGTVTEDVQYSLIQGGWAAGSNILDVDPLFVNPNTGVLPTLRDYRLGAGSPAQDAGNNALAIYFDTNAIPFDRDLMPRIVDGTVDMGAYEAPFVAVGVDVDGDGLVTPLDAMYVINRLGTTNPTADVDGDGLVEPTDAAAVLNALGDVVSES